MKEERRRVEKKEKRRKREKERARWREEEEWEEEIQRLFSSGIKNRIQTIHLCRLVYYRDKYMVSGYPQRMRLQRRLDRI